MIQKLSQHFFTKSLLLFYVFANLLLSACNREELEIIPEGEIHEVEVGTELTLTGLKKVDTDLNHNYITTGYTITFYGENLRNEQGRRIQELVFDNVDLKNFRKTLQTEGDIYVTVEHPDFAFWDDEYMESKAFYATYDQQLPTSNASLVKIHLMLPQGGFGLIAERGVKRRIRKVYINGNAYQWESRGKRTKYKSFINDGKFHYITAADGDVRFKLIIVTKNYDRDGDPIVIWKSHKVIAGESERYVITSIDDDDDDWNVLSHHESQAYIALE